MASELALAHIEAQRRLRALVESGVTAAWTGLPGYDRENVDEWLSIVLPLVLTGQRQSVALTEAFLARALERQPVGIDPRTVIGPATRAGAPLDEVYTRPFVTVWTALAAGTAWEQAVSNGLARATGLATTDVQLAQRATLGAVQDADPRIRGYRRAVNPGACSFCQMIDGAFVKRADAMELHPGCGCTLEPEMRDVDPTPTPEGVAVHEHGELGPVLGDPAHNFDAL